MKVLNDRKLGNGRILHLQIERGFRFANGGGLGMIIPLFLETRTFVPSSKNRREILVGSLFQKHDEGGIQVSGGI